VFPCDKCTKVFTKRLALKSHQAVHAAKVNTCYFCKKTFARRHDMLRHERNVHSDLKEYRCKTCGIKFDHLQDLKSHCDAESHFPSENIGSVPMKCFDRKSDMRIIVPQKQRHTLTT
jgi:uncharacterized Zn-finger protein